ncbi:unnamed protein product [Lepeophtheirus salmonis]|uniref:(salmon louse) hypothetical protein n=1 Tax=Lepeophtheirus salmonis TaxID=72036 RepID=A0A7R8HB67_LEPSM|nr:unnamed protein product [Lepeophtheirus salmonis]CAF2981558.1 unnamed protein product [Lepeophtheirus salmonis]
MLLMLIYIWEPIRKDYHEDRVLKSLVSSPKLSQTTLKEKKAGKVQQTPDASQIQEDNSKRNSDNSSFVLERPPPSRKSPICEKCTKRKKVILLCPDMGYGIGVLRGSLFEKKKNKWNKVDESLLSSDTGGEDPPLPPPPSYPWVQMALPGGGIVSVPLQDNSRLDSPGGGDPSVTSASAPTSGGSGGLPASDVLTVNAGEPVTHFNLDQLLEIVQSFQLDATMAGHEEGGSSRDLQALVEPSLLGKGHLNIKQKMST